MLLSGKRIFIVEDDINNRIVVEMLLTNNGAQTSFERWGTDTLRLLQRFSPVDVIILDLMFPREISGYEIFDHIRQDETFANIPIVAVSAAEPNESIRKTKTKGFAGFIAKPIDFRLFPGQIAAIIAGESVWYKRQ